MNISRETRSGRHKREPYRKKRINKSWKIKKRLKLRLQQAVKFPPVQFQDLNPKVNLNFSQRSEAVE